MNQPTNSNLNNYGICYDWRHVPVTQVTEWLISMGLATARHGCWRALRLIIQTIKWNVFIYQDLKHKSFAQALQLILKGCTQCRELLLCAGSGEGCQWQALPSPVQCEETATRTRDLPVCLLTH